MSNVTTALKAAVRKHALNDGITTSGWTDEQIAEYASKHFIEGSQPFKAPKAEPKKAEPKKAKAGSIEEAIAEIVRGELQESIDEVASQVEGKLDEARVNELIAEAGVDEKKIVDLVKKHSAAPISVTVENKSTGNSVTRDMVHEMYPTVMSYIAAGENVAVPGPAGSGKSTIFQHAAEDLGLDYYFLGAVQQEHKVLGFIDGHGAYHTTPFREAYEKGGLFVFEEFDGSGARALLAINNAVAGDYCDFPDGMVKKHENFVCAMAGNTYGTGASRQYVGRQQLDSATLDRFAFLEVGYDEKLERSVALTKIEDQDAGNAWVSEVQAFRRKVEQAGIRHVVSPRASIKGCNLLQHGIDPKLVTQSLLHKGLSADQLNQIASA